MNTLRVVTALLATVAAAGCSSRDSEPQGEIGQSLTRAELPKSADLHYAVSQPSTKQAWELDTTIRTTGDDARRITLSRHGLGDDSIVVVATNARGAFALRQTGDAVWRRFEAFSVPPSSVNVGQEWKPFSGADYGDTSTGMVIDSARSYRVVSLVETTRGTLYRAVFNVKPHVAHSDYDDGEWPYSDDVLGVGCAEWFVPRGSGQSFLVGNAEYRFLTDARPSSLAVHDESELRARIADVPTFLTLTCLRGGLNDALEASRERPSSDRAPGLDQCNLSL